MLHVIKIIFVMFVNITYIYISDWLADDRSLNSVHIFGLIVCFIRFSMDWTTHDNWTCYLRFK